VEKKRRELGVIDQLLIGWTECEHVINWKKWALFGQKWPEVLHISSATWWSSVIHIFSVFISNTYMF